MLKLKRHIPVSNSILRTGSENLINSLITLNMYYYKVCNDCVKNSISVFKTDP